MESPPPGRGSNLWLLETPNSSTPTRSSEIALKDGANPTKYKILAGMVTDAINAHPDGVRGLADGARAAGASGAEVIEAVEVAYLFGGTAALVMGVNAFSS